IHSDASVETAAPMCARNSMRLAGQSCISVQNIYAHESVYDRFVAALEVEIKKLKVGDPLDPDTDIGTLIDENAAKRVESWGGEAVSNGARLVTGGTREGAQLQPTLMVDVVPTMKVVCDEIFGPAVSVQRYSRLEDIAKLVSESRFGLQCG